MTAAKQAMKAMFERMATEMDGFYAEAGPEAHVDGRHAEIGSLCRGRRVLDVGCGTGDLLLLLQAKHADWELYGTDVSAVALRMAWERGVRARLECRADLPKGGFDTVVLSQVLEHVSPEVGIWLMKQASRLGRRVVVSVPNGQAVKSRYHVRQFTAETLKQWLGHFGRTRLHDWAGERQRLIAVVGD